MKRIIYIGMDVHSTSFTLCALEVRIGDEDRIISPVQNAKGEFFDSSRHEGTDMPLDADANGAYHIALKGRYLLRHDISEGKPGKLTTEEWLKFAQQRNG